MLKRMTALLLIAALSLMGFALAEAGSAAADAEAIERFTDTWVDDGVAVEIWFDEDDAAFHCHVVLGDGGDVSDVIEYGTCRYDGERCELVCENGVHTRESYDEAAQDVKSEVVASGVTATFTYEADKLIWNDSEDLGGKFELQRLAEAEQQEWDEAQAFIGRWGCGRATIDIIGRNDGSYGVEITWGGSAWETAVWTYECTYDGVKHQMHNYEPGTKSVVTYGEDGEIASTVVEYEDGEATFTIDDDDLLTWNDAKENAGDGMDFVRGILPDTPADAPNESEMPGQAAEASDEWWDEEDDEEMAEGADSDWYMAVLADGDLTARYPFHSFADVNGNGVPVLIISTTEASFIGAEDSARVYVYDHGEPRQVLEVGQSGGDKFYCNADEHTLTHYSRLSGEAHIEVYRVKDGALELVTKADTYQPHHSPEDDNAETVCYQDGEAISEEDCDALFERYAGDGDEIAYERTEYAGI